MPPLHQAVEQYHIEMRLFSLIEISRNELVARLVRAAREGAFTGSELRCRSLYGYITFHSVKQAQPEIAHWYLN